MKLIKTIAALALLAIMTGCASVNMAPQQESAAAKEFTYPGDGKAGIYVFRKDIPVGVSLKKDIWIDGECVGESARGVFFYKQVEGGQEHEIATESEFSPNTLTLFTEAGNNYFVEQYIKLGVFVGGANLRQHDEEDGMREVSKLDLAASGNCSKEI
ncbi:DUF2846 domain-containing protein [Halomonas sp. PBN3]|uniref:DUF2846 domain-containing protein n=1 Tax=Halomonas sp. PBN3 TaxID=1397528 RepID=UPI0003B8D6A6|nr:DUF2846 domain-containing protein [Halomonas sp. PBN3]ERS83842.1 hypothetical protein Q671_02565 [Halomonas sp. PBN3]